MAIFRVKEVVLADGTRQAVLMPFDETTVTVNGETLKGRLVDVDEENNTIHLDTMQDMLGEDPGLLGNNTFSLDAVDKTIRYILTNNYTKLMYLEDKRLNIKRYDFRFSEFIEEPRLVKKGERVAYPKRYIAYVYDRFVHETQRRAYRASDVFHEPINMIEIADRPKIFYRNFLLFVEGQLINTAEVYPLDDRLGIIIDVATALFPHGISLETYNHYVSTDAHITLFLIPNYTIGVAETNRATLAAASGSFEIKRLEKFDEKFKKVTDGFDAPPLFFFNRGRDQAIGDMSDTTCSFTYDASTGMPDTFYANPTHLPESVMDYRFVVIKFNHVAAVLDSNEEDILFDLGELQVPVPTCNFFSMRKREDGMDVPVYRFDPDVGIEHFYPNIYAIADVLPHKSALPSMKLSEEATAAGITDMPINYYTTTKELPEDSEIVLCDVPWTLKKGIYALKHCHLVSGDLVFPEDVPNTKDVTNSVIRVFEDDLQIDKVIFRGPSDANGSYRVVVEPGTEVHSDFIDYEFDRKDMSVRHYVFYEDIADEDPDIVDDYEAYNRYRDIFEDYLNSDVPAPLVTYVQGDLAYSFADYNVSIWYPSISNYKIARLRGYLEEYPNFMKAYFNNLRLPVYKYCIDVSLFVLTERLRIDTSQENLINGEVITFENPRYVFAMNRQFLWHGNYDFRLFVDGQFLTYNEYSIYNNLDFYFLYIDADLIKKDSIIEIERFRLYSDLNEVVFEDTEEAKSDMTVTMNIPEPNVVQAREIFVARMDTNKYLTGDQYQLSYYNDYLKGDCVIQPDSCFVVSGFDVKIKILDETLKGVTLRYGVNQSSTMYTSKEYDMTTEEAMLHGEGIIYVKAEYRNTGHFDPNSYRVFNKGRLMLPPMYTVRNTDVYGDNDIVRTKCMVEVGDQFTLDHTPSVYRTVYFQKEIEENGYVDLDGVIPLPISLKYYDVYLNGLRLNHKHMEMVSPTKMYIKNVKSIYNLLIMERNHDDDVFFLTSFAYKEPGHSDTPMDRLMRDLEWFRDFVHDLHDVLENSEHDQLIGGVLSEDSVSEIFVFSEIIWNTHVNANIFNDEKALEVKEEYPELMSGENQDVFHLESINRIESSKLQMIVNPNINIEKYLGDAPLKKGAYRHVSCATATGVPDTTDRSQASQGV